MNAYNVTPAQVLIEDDGEPELGSIVIDSCGVAYQHRVYEGVAGWYECGFTTRLSWDSLGVFGPLALVAVSFTDVVKDPEWWDSAA